MIIKYAYPYPVITTSQWIAEWVFAYRGIYEREIWDWLNHAEKRINTSIPLHRANPYEKAYLTRS